MTLVPFETLEERLAPERDELTFVLWASAGALLITAVTMAVVARRTWAFAGAHRRSTWYVFRREGAKWKALTRAPPT